jgi:hypothetical protein
MSLILSGSDGLSDVDGSAATPAIRGTDTNTGIFFGSDIIGFSEGGVEAMRINASGVLVTTNDASISGLTVGKGGGGGSDNTVVGYQAALNATGNFLTAVGYQAGYSNTDTAFANAFFGRQAGKANTTGGGGVAVGNAALIANTTGNQNTGVGASAMEANTTGANNTAVGSGSLGNNTTASNNTAVGYQAAYSNTSGANNTAVGYFALKSTAGNTANNTAVGSNALQANTSGENNTAVGYQAGYSNTTATEGAFFGYQAGRDTTAGSNTIIGSSAGVGVTTGSNNTMLGTASGNWVNVLTTGANNVYLGYGCNPSSATVSNETIVGYNGTGKGTTTGFYVASGGNYQSNNSASWSTTSDQRLKKNIVDNTTGLEVINKIQVRNFEYRIADEVTDLPKEQVIDKTGIQLGVIAQELQTILPECVKEQSTGVLTIDTDNLTWYLINAVKELKAEIDQLKGK